MKRLSSIFVSALAATLLGSGCVAFSVGKPEIHEVPAESVPQTRAEKGLDLLATGIKTLSVKIEPTVSYDVETTVSLKKRDTSLSMADRIAMQDRDLKKGEVAIGFSTKVGGTLGMARNVPAPWLVEVRKKVAFGLFPGCAESVFHHSDDALQPFDADGINHPHTGNARGATRNLLYPVTALGATVCSLLWEPFDWRDRAFACGTHGFCGDSETGNGVAKYGYKKEDDLPFRVALQVPGLNLARRADMPTRTVTWKDPWTKKDWEETVRTHSLQFDFTHQSLFGFHKWREIAVKRGETAQTMPGNDCAFSTIGPGVSPKGAFELSIPSMNWSQQRRIADNSRKVVFSLPSAAPGKDRVEATLRLVSGDADSGMLENGGIVNNVYYGPGVFPNTAEQAKLFYSCSEQEKLEIAAKTLSALSESLANGVGLRLWLPVDSSLAASSPQPAASPPPAVVMNEVHHWHAPAGQEKKERPYDLTTEEPYSAGCMVVRVDIRDESKTESEIDADVRPFLESSVRGAFAAENPDVPEGSIRVHAVATPGGRAIRYVVSAWAEKE